MNSVDNLLQKGFKGYSKAIDYIKKSDSHVNGKLRAALTGGLYTKYPANSLGHHIMRRLGHISISPRDVYNLNMLRDSYVYHADEKFLNTEKNTDNFVKRILSFDKNFNNEEKKLRHEYRWLEGSHVFILHQVRGGGKTFFINHLFSKYKKKFDEEKILFIRANLVNSFETEENFLNEWIYAQLLRIVLRHHDPKSKAFIYSTENSKMAIDASGILSDIINDIEYPLKEKAAEKIDILKSTLMEERPRRAIIQGDIPEYISTRFAGKILDLGYRIFFVIDGLDRVEPLVHFKDKYNSLLKQIGPVVMDEYSGKICFTIVTRTCNLATIKERLKVRKDGGGITPPIPLENIFKIGAVDSKKILRRRIECLFEESEKILNDPNITLRDKKEASYWKKHLESFMGYLQYSASPHLKNVYGHLPEQHWYEYNDHSYYFDFLDNNFGKNNRAKAQLTQCNYFNFLNETKMKKYMLVESLMLAGQEIPPIAYEYKYIEAQNKLKMFSGNSYFDNSFLPNIFLYPYDSANYKYPSNNTPLMGLRILQLVVSHQNYMRSRQEVVESYWKIEDYLRVLNILFGYDKAVMLSLIDEFMEAELIMTNMNIVRPPKTEEYIVFPAPKTKYYLDSLIYDIAYLNLCAMRVLINPNFFTPEIPYFRATHFIDVPIRIWVKNKVLNSLGFVNLIEIENKREKQFYKKKLSKLNSPFDKQFHLDFEKTFSSFIPQMEKEVRQQITVLLFSFLPDQESFIFDIISEIDKYSRKWFLQKRKDETEKYIEQLKTEVLRRMDYS